MMPRENQGIDDTRYKLIPRVLIFLFFGEEVLLIQGAPDKKIWANMYNGIGGHVERGEDIFSAAKREIFEETGLVDIQPQLCGLITIDASSTAGIGLFVFKGISNTRFVEESAEGVLQWVNINKLNELPLVEDLQVILPKVLNFSSTAPIFSAQYSYSQSGELTISIFDE